MLRQKHEIRGNEAERLIAVFKSVSLYKQVRRKEERN